MVRVSSMAEAGSFLRADVVPLYDWSGDFVEWRTHVAERVRGDNKARDCVVGGRTHMLCGCVLEEGPTVKACPVPMRQAARANWESRGMLD